MALINSLITLLKKRRSPAPPTRILLLFFLIGGTISTALAQERVSEEEINLQKVFIDANRQRLLGNYDEALSLYKEVLRADSENHAALYETARIHEVQEELEKAISTVNKALQIAPTNEWYQKYAADLYQKTGQDDKAAELYEELVDRAPNNDYYYYKWAYFLVRANEIEEALEVYEKLEKKFGLNEELARRKHSLYLGIGDQKNAANELKRLIDAFPEITDYRHLLASFYQRMGEDKRAVKVYKEILTIDPNDQKAQIGALSEQQSGQSEEVKYLNALAGAFQQEDLSIDLKIEKIIPFIRKVADTEDRALADVLLNLTNILEKVHPDEAKGFSAAGDLLYYSGRRAAAIQKYTQTLALDDTVFPVWEQLLYALSEERNYKQLSAQSEEAMDLFPNKAIVYYFNGMANHQLDKLEDAQEVLEMALLMASGNGRLQFDIQRQLGETYFALGEFSESNNAFEAALKLNPKAPRVLANYSYCLAQRNAQLDKALAMAEQANELAPNRSAFQHSLGWVYYKKKEYEKAAEWLKKAAESNLTNAPDTFEHYGDVLYQLGDVEQAVRYWTQAQDNGSKSSLIEKKIADRKFYE
ncbi:MAG: tetratricopeptide repeat protein [Bacteroidota bacterium]